MNRTHYNPELLRDARKASGLTMKGAAKELGVKRQTVYRAETGRIVSYPLLSRMADLYRIPVSNLIRETA